MSTEPGAKGGDPLDDLAGSVSDGGDVDWREATESSHGGPSASTVLALQDVARIAQFNRDRQRAAGPDAGPGDDDHQATDAPRWAHLVLLEPIGKGATGDVWRAWDPELRRDVALKFLSATGPGLDEVQGARLLSEARALARVQHPGVVTVHGIAEDGGRTALWMEYLRGATLAETIERRGALPPTEVRAIGAALADALDAVHRAGLVHGDVKPANILLTDDGRTILTDFGLGRFRHDERIARRGSGTPVFMAPELFEGGAGTPASDLYALGVTLRWALAGHSPFAAHTVQELWAESAAGPAVRLADAAPDAPESLVSAIERTMAPKAADRFASGAALRAALTETMSGPESSETPAKPLTSSRAGRRRVGRMIGAAASVVVAIGVVWQMSSRRSEPVNLSQAELARKTGKAGFPSPPPGPAPAFDVEAVMLKRTGGVSARLAPGDRVSPGDYLSMEVRTTRPTYLYVLNEDEHGETYLLFPQPRFDLVNPVPADSALVLPGPIGGRENAWRVTSRGGKEHFLIVASAAALYPIEVELAKLPAARPGRPIEYAAIPAEVVERLRGIGGVAPLPETGRNRGHLFADMQALAGREHVDAGALWMRTITLDNPER